jgi:putative nucleotidyltransferase with HDIG domain
MEIRIFVAKTSYLFAKKNNNLIYDNVNFKTINVFQNPPVDSTPLIQKLAVIAFALGLKDQYTEGHARRVAAYAAKLAARMGLPAAEIENIRLGGLLHDIGKIWLSERIFRSTEAELPEDMLAEVHRHPWIGMSMLKYFRFPSPIPEYVYCHHERIDGKGYPCGISSEEIPLGAKIISVADCFDAMTTDRPYQKGKSIPEALVILDHMRGKSLSSEIVADLFKEIRQNGMSERKQKKNYSPRSTSPLHRSNDFRISR